MVSLAYARLDDDHGKTRVAASVISSVSSFYSDVQPASNGGEFVQRHTLQRFLMVSSMDIAPSLRLECDKSNFRYHQEKSSTLSSLPTRGESAFANSRSRGTAPKA